MKHSVVYSDPSMYAGWPANHGAWQWGDEFLVGFLRGPYSSQSMHNITTPFEKVQARSLDGGDTWTVEKPNVDFEGRSKNYSPDRAPRFSLKDSIIRVCGVYDHGGDDCPDAGAFYLSSDKGKKWTGPFAFDGFEFLPDEHCTARTMVVGNKVFLTVADVNQWGTDFPLVVEHDGERFSRKARVFSGKGRAAMPSVAVSRGRMVAAVRRREVGKIDGWIDAFGSDDQGATWRPLSKIGDTGNYNGNPPALIASGDKLICTYANRTERRICAKVSKDLGASWSDVLTVRDGGDSDIGYPQLFMREDGIPVCVYYWCDPETNSNRQHIAATRLDSL